jgi:hypothetical protein
MEEVKKCKRILRLIEKKINIDDFDDDEKEA